VGDQVLHLDASVWPGANSGTDFTVVGGASLDLASGQARRVTVHFAATATTPTRESATLVLYSNDPYEWATRLSLVSREAAPKAFSLVPFQSRDKPDALAVQVHYQSST